MAAVDNLLDCSICLEWLHEPTTLPCGHVFCLKHLHKLVDTNNQLKCPDCRKLHPVPNGDVQHFPRDFRIVEYLKSDAVKKGQCKECNTKENVSKCDHCDQDICTECQEGHKFMVIFVLQRVLKDFATKFLQSENGDITEIELKEKEETKEKMEEYIKEINDEFNHVNNQVAKRRDELLTPFQQKLKEIVEIKPLMEFHQQIKKKLENADTSIKEIQQLKGNIAEKINTLPETLCQSNELIQDLNLVSFQSKRKDLYTIIADYGQIADLSVGKSAEDQIPSVRVGQSGEGCEVIDYSKYELMRAIECPVHHEEFSLHPSGLAICPQTDHVYVTYFDSQRSSKICEYDNEINLIKKIEIDYIPAAIAVIVVNNRRRIFVVQARDTKVFGYNEYLEKIRSFNTSQYGPNILSNMDLICDVHSNIYILCHCADNHKCIVVFRSDGEFINKFEEGIPKNSRFIQITRNDKLLVTTVSPYLVFVFNLQGEHEGYLGEDILSNYTITEKVVDVRCGICVDNSGNVLVPNPGKKTIEVFSPNFLHLTTIIDKNYDIFEDIHYSAVNNKTGQLYVISGYKNITYILY